MQVDLLVKQKFDAQTAQGESRLVFHHAAQSQSLISIVIPTYKRDDLLVQAVLSAINQSGFASYEIIIVDNNPDSDASLIKYLTITAATPTIKYYVNPRNLGMFGNWNRGIALAQGQWITLLHDDDWLYPDFLNTANVFLRSDYDVLACASAIGEDDYPLAPLPPASSRIVRAGKISINRLILGNISPAPGILIRKSLLVEVGGFDEKYYPCSDYFTYVRCALNGKALIIRQTLAYYRTSDSQTFKGDTLARMVTMSARIKIELMKLSNRKWTSRLYYLLSMATWYRLSRRKASPVVLHDDTILNRCAELLSHSGVLLSVALKANALWSAMSCMKFSRSGLRG